MKGFVSFSIMKTRKAFSIIEPLLVIIILGLLAAVFVPASAIIKEKARVKIVEKNLVEIAEVGKKYNAENASPFVTYKTLVETKSMKPVEVMAGEDYNDLRISASGGKLEVKTAKGSKASIVY